MTKRIVILMSDTGGGHRAAAAAIREALDDEYGAGVSVELIDGLRRYAPYPFSRFPAWYPAMSSNRVWEPGYHLIDGRRRTRALNNAVWPYVRRGVRRLVRENPCDVIISVHLLLTGPVLRARGAGGPPVVNVVTDLVTTHALWFHPQADSTLVPTEAARQRARACRVPPERVRVVGLPVARKFSRPIASREAVRAELGWLPDAPAVLLVGGGSGMGPLGAIARRLAASGLPIQIAVVCGRNGALRAELEAESWPLPVHVYGYVHNMPELMTASDMVVTKAGPSSIMEALHCGRPLVLSGAIPGQEDGNIQYVLEKGCGLWAPGPARVVDAVARLTNGSGGELARMAARAVGLAKPDAARAIAQQIGGLMAQVRVESTPGCQ